VRGIVQRVRRARVTVELDGVCEMVGEIGPGLCVLLGVTHDDTEAEAVRMADKLAKLRIFADTDGKMNLSVSDTGGQVLVVSQFTLYGDAVKGNRPSFVAAAGPEVAEHLIDTTIAALRRAGLHVETGRFGADMDVELVNQGPVTIIVEVPGSA
jgi:D-aminoacyl-tRNA deacylase